MNKILTLGTLLLSLSLGLAGCAGPSDGPAPAESPAPAVAVPEIVQKAVAVARAIEEEPDQVEAILERNGLDAEGFEELMYRISSDSELRAAYNAALSR